MLALGLVGFHLKQSEKSILFSFSHIGVYSFKVPFKYFCVYYPIFWLFPVSWKYILTKFPHDFVFDPSVLYKCLVKYPDICPTLWDPMDCSLPGSSIRGIFQARILEWVAIFFSKRSSQLRDWTRVSHIIGRCLTIWATRWISPIFCLFSNLIALWLGNIIYILGLISVLLNLKFVKLSGLPWWLRQ